MRKSLRLKLSWKSLQGPLYGKGIEVDEVYFGVHYQCTAIDLDFIMCKERWYFCPNLLEEGLEDILFWNIFFGSHSIFSINRALRTTTEAEPPLSSGHAADSRSIQDLDCYSA